jgi:hypothetical protein
MGRLLICDVYVIPSMHRFTAQERKLTYLVTRPNSPNVLEEVPRVVLCFVQLIWVSTCLDISLLIFILLL